eukprot:1387154-Amorphochlora_amoeboformis.AAC.1
MTHPQARPPALSQHPPVSRRMLPTAFFLAITSFFLAQDSQERGASLGLRRIHNQLPPKKHATLSRLMDFRGGTDDKDRQGGNNNERRIDEDGGERRRRRRRRRKRKDGEAEGKGKEEKEAKKGGKGEKGEERRERREAKRSKNYTDPFGTTVDAGLIVLFLSIFSISMLVTFVPVSSPSKSDTAPDWENDP